MNDTTLHIPMEKTVRTRLEAKAKKLGFDSAQAYIRVWVKAETEGRTVNFGDDWGEPSPATVKRLNQATEEDLRGENISGPFSTAKEMLDHLHSL